MMSSIIKYFSYDFRRDIPAVFIKIVLEIQDDISVNLLAGLNTAGFCIFSYGFRHATNGQKYFVLFQKFLMSIVWCFGKVGLFQVIG